jgi:hypothetical protein
VLVIRGYGRRLMDQLEAAIAGAWHGEGFARTKRLPDLDKIIGKQQGRRPPADRAFTANETRRWAKHFAEQAAK